ncbi:MAG: tRNA pseudouridine(55) synthase TruB [Coriobacteriales bacterium]|nr:tRNA pseudouridine(55) synthase TruB [Coriobacteriales bacterium]
MPKAKRGATDLNGVILIDKPGGMTSHDVVDRLRELTGEGRIGHAGTLDPAATGLLILCVGPATRLSDQLMGHDKEYVARIIFGASTDTDDAEGNVVKTFKGELPADLTDPIYADEVLTSFLGHQSQMPPQFSAIKQNGVAAYKKARQGEKNTLKPREVDILDINLFVADADSWVISTHVSKGTYIRSLARDIGERVGCPAHLGELKRTGVGPWNLTRAHSLDKLADLSVAEIEALFLSEEELKSGLLPKELSE